jgi:glycosyltransferase involved in cell wall biosynthesis
MRKRKPENGQPVLDNALQRSVPLLRKVGSMPALQLSLSIISCNEEVNLRRCLESAADLAAEIIVVDSGSKDRTREVAAEFGAKVQHQDWLGHRDQKNVALRLCSQPWVLALDSDEALSVELRQAIRDFFAKPDAERPDGAWMNRRTHFLGRWIRHGDWYPDRKLRLFRREGACWSGSPEHDYVQLPPVAKECRLAGDMLHYSFRDMSHYLQKHVGYADVFLQREKDRGGSFSVVSTLFRACWRFFRGYVLRLGFLDGFAGLWIAVATGFFAFVRHSRTYELRGGREEA